jgi:hypothetical protein
MEMSPIAMPCERLQTYGRPIIVKGLQAGRDLYHATPVVAWDLGFHNYLKDHPFSCLLQQVRAIIGSYLYSALHRISRFVLAETQHATFSIYCRSTNIHWVKISFF